MDTPASRYIAGRTRSNGDAVAEDQVLHLQWNTSPTLHPRDGLSNGGAGCSSGRSAYNRSFLYQYIRFCRARSNARRNVSHMTPHERKPTTLRFATFLSSSAYGLYDYISRYIGEQL